MNGITRSLALCLALVGLVTLSACDSGGSGTAVRGNVENSFGAPVEEATVEFTPTGLVPDGSSSSLGGGGVECLTDDQGDFECEDIADGFYTMSVSASGYATQTREVDVSGDTEVTVPTLVGLATIDDAQLIDAASNLLDSATLHCHRALDSGGYSTNAEFNTTSSASGLVNASNVFGGGAECFIADGSESYVAYPTIADVHTAPIQALARLEAGEYRVVLTWGVTPSDLDSHLTGPDGSGGRFHVYYADRFFAAHNLDQDDRSSFGPETITIRPDGEDGLYRYSVHNFSDQTNTGSTGIAQSPTRVRVLDRNGLVRTFVAPGATPGNTWRVFEMTVNGSSVTFNPNSSQAGLGYFQADSDSDMTVFLTGGGEVPGGKSND